MTGVPQDSVKGIGFDATCSLAVLDQYHLPVSVSPFGMWNELSQFLRESFFTCN